MARRKARRLVRRYYAERYLLITITAFAFSVSATRFFLDITGYPQIGGSQLHIAHVVWGGLLLYIGGLFPLIFANKRAFDLSALFSGVGVGLFIDEVGKFITQGNDYFFPAAVPIIYAFFLLTLMVFFLVRRARPKNLRTRLYHVIERFEEILEGDLSKKERDRMLLELQMSLNSKDEMGLAAIATDMTAYLQQRENDLVPHHPDFLENLAVKWLRFEDRIFRYSGFFSGLRWCWGIWGAVLMIHPVIAFLFEHSGFFLPPLWIKLLSSDLLSITDLSMTGWVRLVGEGFCGLLLVIAGGIRGESSIATALRLALISLLMFLIIVNIFVFYYDQFSAIVFTLIHSAILLITLRYRQHILR